MAHMMSTNEVVLLCRLGGEFIWESDDVYYKGGTNRIVHVDRVINYLDLLCKVRGICKSTDISSIQYKYPGLDLDTLVSIGNDEDISQMMEAFPQNNEPIQLFVNPLISIAIPSNLMQNADTRNAQASVQDLHGGYKTLASSSHNVDAHNYDVPSGSNDLHGRIHNMQKVMPVLKEGQEFEDANAFHKALKEYAKHSNFQYKQTRSGGGHFQAKCIKDGCLWWIYACKLPEKPTFKIKFLKGNHTCNATKESTMSNTNRHLQSSTKWIATLVKHRLRKNLPCTPKDIVNEISRKYKIRVSYDKAWRGKEFALKDLALKDLALELYDPDLKMLCKEIEKTNPGSTAKLSRSSDNSLRLFVTYKAAICGFKKACRPVVRLERKKIKGEYPGEWFFAMAIDADMMDFPISYAFVESEIIGSWKWFFGELTQVLGCISELTFISDRQEEILEEVSIFFPNACHRYHCEGLFREIYQKFKCVHLFDLFKRAMYAPFHSEFDDCMHQIQAKYKEAWNFVKAINPKHWATSHFEGKFYVCHNHVSDFMVPWMYGVESRGKLPITSMLVNLHVTMTEKFDGSFKESSKLKRIFIPRVQKVISKAEKYSERYSVSGSATEFEVLVIGEGAFKVDIQHGVCSCLSWQKHGNPCQHAIAAIPYSGSNVCDYFDYLTVAKYQETYSEVIYPLTFEPKQMKKRKYVHEPIRFKQAAAAAAAVAAAADDDDDEDDDDDDQIDVLHPVNRGC